METKQHIRKLILAERQKCSSAFIESASRKITERVLSLDEFKQAESLLVYLSYRNEAMTRYLIEEAWRMGKTAAAPKVCGQRMDFYKIRSFDEVSPGFRGIPEPTATDDKGPFCPENALVIMPGAVFDRQRHRIGYGGGYYDRFLSKHPDMTKLAVAFDFQVQDRIPVNEYDISADLIVTERQIYR